MPCEECEEGLYKWGKTGECMYETLEDCQLANQGEYLEEVLKKEKYKNKIFLNQYYYLVLLFSDTSILPNT